LLDAAIFLAKAMTAGATGSRPTHTRSVNVRTPGSALDGHPNIKLKVTHNILKVTHAGPQRCDLGHSLTHGQRIVRSCLPAPYHWDQLGQA